MSDPGDILDDALRVALDVGSLLDDLGVPWYIGGSVASSFHGLPRSTLDVDVYPLRADTLARREMKERLQHRLTDGRVVPVARPEHVLLEKLSWYRAGGEVSDRQWGDVLGVLGVQAGQIDVAEMRALAGEVGVGDLLERALTEAAARG